MTARDLATVLGAFCMSFGEMLKTQAPSVTAFWIGQGMIVLGPLLIAGRAINFNEKPRSRAVRRN